MSYLNITQRANVVGIKTKIFDVQSIAGDTLGVISFRPQWRKFVFTPAPGTLYDAGCLREIADFEEQQTQYWRNSL